MRAVLLSLLFLALAPTAHAAGWLPARTFAGTAGEESVPRAAISASGSSTVAWQRADKRLVVSHGNAAGRFRAPKVIAKRVTDWAVAPGAVAYEARDGVHVYVGGRDRLVARSGGSEINGVAIAADPLGGYVLAERSFVRRGATRSYHVRALSVDADGRVVGAVQELGPGQFGIDARPAQALSVLPDGRAVLVFQREAPSFQEPEPVVYAIRPHGGAFGEPAVVGDGLTDPRITGSTITVTRIAGCGDTGCAGEPRAIAVNPDGTLGTPSGPALPNPRRAFAPWATAGAIVFLLKTRSKPFSVEAPVRAYAADGRLQTLTRALANEPVALALADGRTVALWATRTRLGAALAGADGVFKRTSAPAGPPPYRFHFNSTNRDARSAGRWVIFAWAHGSAVRVSTRRF
jgi:hypothetical protein